MKCFLTILFFAFSCTFHAQQVDTTQNAKGNGEYKYTLTKEGIDLEEKTLSLENVTLNEFYDAVKQISNDNKLEGYETTEASFKHTPHGQKSPKLGKYELELTIQKDDQETQKRSFVFENVSYFEGNDKFKYQIDLLGEEGYIVKSYNKNFSTYESLSQKEND